MTFLGITLSYNALLIIGAISIAAIIFLLFVIIKHFVGKKKIAKMKRNNS